MTLVLSNGRKIISAQFVIADKIIPLQPLIEGNTKKVRCFVSYLLNFKIQNDEFKVKIRVDWGKKSIDKYGNPALDTDICKNGLELNPTINTSHHVFQSNINGEWMYKWDIESTEFTSSSLQIKLATTNQYTISGRASIAPATKQSDGLEEQIIESLKKLEEL